VSFPEPYAGLVIRYSYLWKREYEQGREEGVKDRPCAVVLVVTDDDGEKDVLVIPITHTPPPDPNSAVEIPIETKRRLGLDAERSWIVVTEANEFVWPGPDLRPLPGRDASTVAYGPLPPRLFAQVRNKFLERDRTEKSARVARTE
jgi:hypothetical protein